MLTKINRLAVLTEKALSGTITDEERAEAATLQAEIARATAPVDLTKVATTLTTMTVQEFQAHADAVRAADPPDPVDLALMRKNLEAIKQQDPAGQESVVAVHARADNTPASLEARIAALEAKAATAMVSTGEPAPAPVDPPAAGAPVATKAPGDSPVASALATEAMDAAMMRLTSVKDALASGTLDEESLQKLWPGYDLRRVVEQCVEVLAKVDAIKAVADEVLPALKKIQDDVPPADDAPPADAAPQADDVTPDDNAPPTATKKNDTPSDAAPPSPADIEKAALVQRFLAGQPMGTPRTPEETRRLARTQRRSGLGILRAGA